MLTNPKFSWDWVVVMFHKVVVVFCFLLVMVGNDTEAGQANGSQNKEEWQTNDEPSLVIL